MLPAHRLVEDRDAVLVELDREGCPVVAVERGLGRVVDRPHERGGVVRRRVAVSGRRSATEQHELDAAVDDRHGREPGLLVQRREALELRADRLQLVLAHAEVHVEVGEAACPDLRRGT